MFASCVHRFAYVLGNILTSIGTSTSNADFVKQVETFCSYFLIIGSSLVVLNYFSTACGIISSERQANRIRVAYLKAMMRQDVGWFDVNKPGEVASRMQEDTTSVQGGINESLGLSVQYLMTFVIGLIIGFVRSWQLTLLILAFVPIMIIAGGTMRMATQRQEVIAIASYAKAGFIANEVLANVRTVAAFGGEASETARYDSALEGSEKAGRKKGLFMGLTMGVFMT